MKLKKLNKNQKGFTLIELIVVIAILLLISVLAVVGFGNIIDNARDAALRADAGRLAGQVNNFNTFAHPNNRILTDAQLLAAIGVTGNVTLRLNTAAGAAGEAGAPGRPADTIDGDFTISLEADRVTEVLTWMVAPAAAAGEAGAPAAGVPIWTVLDPDDAPDVPGVPVVPGVPE